MMPEDARGYDLDPAEEYPWDADISWPLDDELGGDEGDDDE